MTKIKNYDQKIYLNGIDFSIYVFFAKENYKNVGYLVEKIYEKINR